MIESDEEKELPSVFRKIIEESIKELLKCVSLLEIPKSYTTLCLALLH